MVLRAGLHRFFRRGSACSECRSRARRRTTEIQIPARLLHGGEGETTPDEDAGELYFSWHYVSFSNRVAPRLRFVGPKQGIDLRSLAQWGIVLCFLKSVSVLPSFANRRNKKFGERIWSLLSQWIYLLLLTSRSCRLLKLQTYCNFFASDYWLTTIVLSLVFLLQSQSIHRNGCRWIIHFDLDRPWNLRPPL